ncbi:MAG: macro domain-containing protein [Ruminococcus sp.]|nr:macro domain-containing protein [Ruminococcus sp.]
MPFHIIRHDITKVKADAVVNTANPMPVIGSGTDSAIYEAAGEEKLLAERKKIGDIEPGHSAYTPAFDLPAKYIIHCVGTYWEDGAHGEWDILRSCYKTALALAAQLKCKSIAFPLMATGAYGYPKAESLDVALQEIGSFRLKTESKNEDMDIYLVVFDDQALELSSREFGAVEQFIDENYVAYQRAREYAPDSRAMRRFRGEMQSVSSLHHIGTKDILESASESINEYLRSHKGQSFRDVLMKYIIASGMENAEVYKKANIDRKLFSKIISKSDYTPKKDTVIALALALELDITQTNDLLKSAGRAFSGSERDALLRVCIENKIYDIMRVDTLLFDCGMDTLS